MTPFEKSSPPLCITICHRATNTMRLLFDVCILTAVAFAVEGFAPVCNNGRVGRATTTARFVAMSPLDNWTDEDDDEFDYEIEPAGKMAGPASPGVVISVSIFWIISEGFSEITSIIS